MVTLIAMEHPTEEARRKYLKEHPQAEPSAHTVKKEGPKEKKEEPEEREPEKKEEKKPKENWRKLPSVKDGKLTSAWFGTGVTGKPIKDLKTRHLDGMLKELEEDVKNENIMKGAIPKAKEDIKALRGELASRGKEPPKRELVKQPKRDWRKLPSVKDGKLTSGWFGTGVTGKPIKDLATRDLEKMKEELEKDLSSRKEKKKEASERVVARFLSGSTR
jgi:hypothetical protein